MKHVATTLTEMQIADEDLDRVCGGFNPQPDPPRLASTLIQNNPPEGDKLALGIWNPGR